MDNDILHSLKPCPFCGSEAVILIGSSVRCGNCGASGPFGCTAEHALERWNERNDGQSSLGEQAPPLLTVADPA
ncbi:MAG: Lar family restriction alleviation protein [Anaerolineae bacterium]